MAEYTKAEAKAGIIMTVALFLLFGLLIFISDYRQIMAPKRVVEVTFQDVQGLKLKDSVRYGGMRVGIVAELKTAEAAGMKTTGSGEDDPYRPPLSHRRAVVVGMKLPSDLDIRRDDHISINKTLTGGLTVDVVPDGKDEVWKPGDPPIRGTEYPGLGHYARRGDALLDMLTDGMAKFKEKSSSVLDSADKLLARFNDIFSDKQQQELQSIIGNMDKTSQNLVATTERINKMLAREGEAGKVLEDLSKTVADVDKLLLDARKDVLDVVKNLRETTEKFSGVTERAEGFLGNLNTLLDRNRDSVSDATAQMKTTADNLMAWSEDVRRHPWLLLRKPDKEETAGKDLVFAARQLRQALLKADGTVEQLLQASRSEAAPKEETSRLTTELKTLMEKIRKIQEDLEEKAK